MKKEYPEEEIFADYLENRLTDEECRQLETYLSDCDNCLEELLIAKNMINNSRLSEYEPVSKHITESAVHLLAKRIPAPRRSMQDVIIQTLKHLWPRIANPDRLTVFSDTALTHVRSYDLAAHPRSFCTKKQFENIETEIEMEKTGPDCALIRVRLISDIQNKYNIRVTLLNKDNREISSFLLTEGFVIFEDIRFGNYNLVFIRNGETIGTYPFEIKGTYHGEQKDRQERTSNRRDGKSTTGTGTPRSNH